MEKKKRRMDRITNYEPMQRSIIRYQKILEKQLLEAALCQNRRQQGQKYYFTLQFTVSTLSFFILPISIGVDQISRRLCFRHTSIMKVKNLKTGQRHCKANSYETRTLEITSGFVYVQTEQPCLLPTNQFRNNTYSCLYVKYGRGDSIQKYF